jgi:hypothetical protein
MHREGDGDRDYAIDACSEPGTGNVLVEPLGEHLRQHTRITEAHRKN